MDRQAERAYISAMDTTTSDNVTAGLVRLEGQAAACELIKGPADCGLVLICDHASNVIPPAYGGLGLPDGERERHIAYDIGAAAVTRHLARLLGAPAVLTRFSRLLIDPNRGEDDPTLIMRLSDGAVIPGNRAFDAGERQRRIDGYYRPYHRAIDGLIDAGMAAGVPPVILSLHSFTDIWRGRERKWHTGVLWDRDPRLAQRLLAGLRRMDGLVVGDNEPYSGQLLGDTLWQHGMMRGLASAIIEIRQDLIREAGGQEKWAELIAGLMREILAAPGARGELNSIGNYRSERDDALAARLLR